MLVHICQSIQRVCTYVYASAHALVIFTSNGRKRANARVICDTFYILVDAKKHTHIPHTYLIHIQIFIMDFERNLFNRWFIAANWRIPLFEGY